MKRTLLVVLAVVLVASLPVRGHHSFAAEYFEDQMISVKGEVVQFDYRNPHSWLHLMVADENGKPERFSAEWGNVGRLTRDGIGKDTLKPGDQVIVSGSPGRNPTDRKIHLKLIERPSDGWKWARRR